MLNYNINQAENQVINDPNSIISSLLTPSLPDFNDSDWLSKAQLLHSTFLGRTDAHGEFLQFSHHECVKKPLTQKVILDHVSGKRHIGIYPLSPSIDNGRSVYFCAHDMDSDVNWLERAVELQSFYYDQWGLELLIERSKSDNSGHI